MLQMNASEQLKLDVVSKLDSGKIDIKRAMQILGKSESTLFRYLRSFKKIGVHFIKHKNSNKTPRNKISSSLEKTIINLCKEKYFDFNRSHAREEMAINEQLFVPKDTFNRICQRNNLLTKNLRKKKKRARHRRDRMKQMGIILQLDGSPHRWFGRHKTCLVACIDDATGDILYGEFSPTETTFACMNVIKKIIKNYGVFQILYTDRAGIFGKNTTNHSCAVKREGFSSLKFCLAYFGIHIIYAHSPEAKGRIERAFRTLQDRLVPEFRLHNINTTAEANKYLNEVYFPKHRNNFVVDPKIKESAFVPLISSVDLDPLFYMVEKRVIKNDHTFSHRGFIIDVLVSGDNYSGKEIQIRSYPDGQVRYFIDDREVEIKQIASEVS